MTARKRIHTERPAKIQYVVVNRDVGLPACQSCCVVPEGSVAIVRYADEFFGTDREGTELLLVDFANYGLRILHEDDIEYITKKEYFAGVLGMKKNNV